MSRVFCTSVLLLLLLGCAQQETKKLPPFRVVADVHELMEGLVAPAADVVFKSVGSIISEKGIEEIQPKDDQGWEVVEHAALGLAESANLLMLEGRAVDQGDWIKHSQDLIDRSLDAAKMAKEKDKDGLLEAGGEVYVVCQSCHMQYIKEDGTAVTAEKK